MSNNEKFEGLLRLGGPSYETLKQVEKYLEKEFAGEIPSDTHFYPLALFDEDEITHYANAEYIVADNEFKGFIFAFENEQLAGALNYIVINKTASITDAYIVSEIRQTGLFKALHSFYKEIVTDMDKYTINLMPCKDNYLFEANSYDEDEQLKINKIIAKKLGYSITENNTAEMKANQ